MWTPSCPIVLFIPNSIIAPKNRHIPQKPRFHAYLSHRWGRSNLNSTCSKNPSLSARTCQVNGVLEGQFITIKSEVSLSHPTNVKYSQLSHWDQEDYKEVQEKLAFKDILWQSSGAIATKKKTDCWGVITNITCFHRWMLGRFHVNWTIFSEFSSCLNLPVRVCIWVKHPSYDKVSCSQWLAHAIEATIAPGAPVFDTLNLNHKRYRSKGRRLHLFLHSCTVNSITLNIPKHPSYSNLNIPKPDLNHHALWPILFFLAMWAVTALGPCSELRCTAQGNAQRWPRLYQDVLPGSFWCPFFRVFVATNQLDQVPQKPPKFVIQKAPGKCPFPSLTFTFRDQKDQISGGIFGCSPRTQKIKHRKLRGQKSLQRVREKHLTPDLNWGQERKKPRQLGGG